MNKTWCDNLDDINVLTEQIEMLGKVSKSKHFKVVPFLTPPVGVYWSEEEGYDGYDYLDEFNKAEGVYVELPDHDDPVNHPSHYTGGKVECIDAMDKFLGSDAVAHFCLCNVFKYLWRHTDKNGEEDVQKALWYFNKYKEIVNR